jgi:hypothetical protein
MAKTELDQIPADKRITVEDAARVLGYSESYIFRGLTEEDGPGLCLKWARAPNPSKGPRNRKIVDARSLPPDAAARLDTEELAGGQDGPSEAQLLLLDINRVRIERRNRVDTLLTIVADCKNGKHAQHGYPRKMPYLKAKAKELGYHWGSIYRLIRQYEDHGIEGLALKKPGPPPSGPGSGYFGKPQNSWAKAHVEGNHRAGLSHPACTRLLLKEIKDRQAHHPNHTYETPSPYQVSVFLRSLPPIQAVAREKGAPGLKQAAGYCDRKITEAAGDTWCIDEWKVDAHLYKDWKLSEVIRPYVLTIMDQRSKMILGWKIVESLESRYVLDLVEETLRRLWAPLRFYSDRGGHFRGKMGRHYRELPKQEVLGPAAGALERLGVLHQGPRRKNPRANRVERLHGFYAARALETLGGSSCGSNEQMGEALSVHARVEEHKGLCKSGDVLKETRLFSYRQFEAIFPKWVEDHNRTESEANGLAGLAPEAAFKTFSPPQSEIETRKVSEERLAIAFAEHFVRTVRPGGVIDCGEENGMPFRYYSPLLVLLAGEECECSRLRHNDYFIVVQSGNERIIADRRLSIGIGDTKAISRAEEERARVEKYLLARYAPDRNQKPGPPPLDPERVIGSSEWMMAHPRRTPITSEEVARRAIEIELEGGEEEPAPSLYDHGECRAE